MTADNKLKQITQYLKRTRKGIDKAIKRDSEYNTTTGNGVNCCEADSMFGEVEQEIGRIIEQ